MIKVLDRIKTKSGLILLVCEMFSDNIITNRIMTNVENYDLFSVDPITECFSKPESRTIVLRQEDVKNMNEIKFINFV